jgi:acetamidase/formamidase
MAKDIAGAGATLVIASRDLAACEALAIEICASGSTAHAEQLDQGSEASILALRDRVMATFGRVDSAPPGINGGNMDDKLLVAGTTLFLPVYVPGALFQAGDGHAAQGNGEVTITALETSLIGTFEFILHKKVATPYPRAETSTAFIAMGFDDDLSNATRKAVRNMIDFLVSAKGMTRDDAYMLISVSGDVEITELVDRNKGVHVVLPKSVFVRP